MRHMYEELNPFSGELQKGKRLSLTLPANTVFRTFLLMTNIPPEYIEAIELANGSDVPFSLSADEILMMERHNKRAVIENIIPFHIADISANTLPGQDSLERPSHANDAHELRVRLSSALPASNDYYLRANAKFASPYTIQRDGAGNIIFDGNNPALAQKVRVNERRFERHTINNVSKGTIVFDKLLRGPKLRTLYIKGDVSKIEMEARKGGTVVKRMEIERDVIEFIQQSEYDLAPQDGYFIFNPVGSGFMSDALNTSYDSLQFKLYHDSDNQTIDILADVDAMVG